jgi:hypothetical protein
MAVAASGQGGIMVRCDPGDTEKLIAKPHARRFEMRGREMDGWLRVGLGALESDADLRRWVDVGLDHARSLPPK